MWAASCFASCSASRTRGLCASAASGISRRSARIAYCGLFGLSLVLSGILREVAAPLLQKLPWINTFSHPPPKEWFQVDAVLRVSLGNFLFFTIFALMMIGVKDKNDKRDSWYHGGWAVKMVIWVWLIVLMFFLPSIIITIYETLLKFGSGLFLLVQVIILLDFTHTWNDAWVGKDEQKWYIALLVISVVCYLATFSLSGVLFIWFNPSGHNCGLNVFFIVMTMILAFVFAVVALHPQTLNKKTVDEVWWDIQRGQNKGYGECRLGQERHGTIGEMTLQDFLGRAGVVVEDPEEKRNGNVGLTGNTDRMVGALGYPQGGQWLQSYHQLLSLHQLQQYQPQQHQQAQQSVMAIYAPSHPVPQHLGVGLGSMLEAGYSDAHLSISSPVMGALSDTQTLGCERVASGDMAEKTVKRMIKNRESAAQSRKQAYTHELENKVSRLEEENERLKKQKVNGRLLPASVISLYCAYLCYSGLSSEPTDYECNGLHKHSTGVSTGTLVLGMLTMVLSVVYSAVRADSSVTFLSPPSSPKSGSRKPLLSPSEIEAGQEESKERDPRPVSYSYTFFHLIFALASMYSAMLLKGWTSSSSDSSDLIDVGWTSVWVRICMEWATAGLYIWTLVAPLVLPNRNFHSLAAS